MAHAEKCPVCDGSGDVATKQCHGCAGRGWVEVKDEAPAVPYIPWYPYPTYPTYPTYPSPATPWYSPVGTTGDAAFTFSGDGKYCSVRMDDGSIGGFHAT